MHHFLSFAAGHLTIAKKLDAGHLDDDEDVANPPYLDILLFRNWWRGGEEEGTLSSQFFSNCISGFHAQRGEGDYFCRQKE